MFQVSYEEVDYKNSEKNKKKIIKTTKVVCTKCSRNLGEMIETDPKLKNNTEIKHIFVCPCGGESFTIKVHNMAYFLSADKLVTTSVLDIGPNKFKSTLETHDGE